MRLFHLLASAGPRGGGSSRQRRPPRKMAFSPEPRDVTAARHFALAVLRDWGVNSDDDGLGEVGLVVSELAGNAVLHGGGPFTVALRSDGPFVRVEVSDGNPQLPAPLEPGPTALHGRGLFVVGRVAGRWGVRPLETGKVVWAELAIARQR